MAIAWLAFGFHTFFVAMAYFLLFKPLFVFRIIFLVVLAYALEVALGIINTSRVDPIRLSIVTLISGFVSYFALLSDAVEDYEFPNGDKSLTSALNFRWAVNILGVYLSLSYLYYTYKIYHNSPPNLLKYARPPNLLKYARLNLVGSIIFGPVSMFVLIFEISLTIPGSFELAVGIGVLISAISIAKKPQLLYVLPFKAVKLMVVDSSSGINIYSHNWSEETIQVNDLLITSVIQSITVFVKEALKRGTIQEIILEEATISVRTHPDHEIFFILISDQLSYTLTSGLELFAKEFINKYASLLRDDIGQMETRLFSSAEELIPTCFPYVPKYSN
jgi:hypothetical protein